MKKRKNIPLFTLMLAAGFVLAACSSTSFARKTSTEDAPASIEETLPAEESSGNINEEAARESEGTILIAYYSHTGNTEEAAQKIAKFTGGTLAKIQRTEEYEDVYEEAEAEILDGVHPEITVSADNIEEYDIIFVGYPIWWDEAPAMIAAFLADHDFSGKTIVPFCTSASDDIGNSLHIFSELCPDAEIVEGLTANDLDEIEPWLSGLGLLNE